MRRFLIFVGLCLTCFALTFGQYENGDDMLSNEIREMVRNAASLEEITAQFDADRQKKSAAKETCTISIKGNETRIGRDITHTRCHLFRFGNGPYRRGPSHLRPRRVRRHRDLQRREETLRTQACHCQRCKHLSELSCVRIRRLCCQGWLYLFKKLSDGMMTYVYLKDADNIELKDVVIENLPKLDPLKVWAA